MDNEQMYTLQEVCVRLKISERTAHRWMTAGKLSALFIGGRWKITETQVQVVIRARNRKDTKGVGQKRKYTKKEKIKG